MSEPARAPAPLVRIERGDAGRAFANPDVFLPAWYPTCRSRALRVAAKKPLVVEVGPVRVALWRDTDGVARALESRCPHLGADLAEGRVVDGQLECALHHWRFRGDGACTHVAGARCGDNGGRRARAFPVVERYGVVFVHPSSTPPIDFPLLPDGDDVRDFRVLTLPEAPVPCHEHLPSANGLDPLHFETLHGLRSLTPWRHDVEPERFAVHLHLHHAHKSAFWQALLGTSRTRFSTHGPSIAWVTAHEPVRMHALFVTRPGAPAMSRAVIFLARGRPFAAARALAFVARVLHQDAKMLRALRTFWPGYTETDAPLRAHAELLEKWPRA